MRLFVLLVLMSMSVWGFPERKEKVQREARQDSHPSQQLQLHRTENKVREAPRDCKAKSATCIAQKAAAEAKAAQAAQNAAGAQAAHMVAIIIIYKYRYLEMSITILN